MRGNSKRKKRKLLKTENRAEGTAYKTQGGIKMAKIDASKIKGYEEMSVEEKLAALENYEYEDNSTELEKYKAAISKANSEAAEWKKKHNALISEDEKKKQAAEEELQALREQVESMNRDKTISEHKAELLALGYEEELAKEGAEALANGDTAKVFAIQRKFLEAHDKVLKTELLKGTPTPPAGSGTDTMTLEKLKNMSVSDRYEFSVSNPEEYEKLYNGGN